MLVDVVSDCRVFCLWNFPSNLFYSVRMCRSIIRQNAHAPTHRKNIICSQLRVYVRFHEHVNSNNSHERADSRLSPVLVPLGLFMKRAEWINCWMVFNYDPEISSWTGPEICFSVIDPAYPWICLCSTFLLLISGFLLTTAYLCLFHIWTQLVPALVLSLLILRLTLVVPDYDLPLQIPSLTLASFWPWCLCWFLVWH